MTMILSFILPMLVTSKRQNPLQFIKHFLALHTQAEEIRVRDGGAPTMNKLDTKRYSCDAPATAMERDVQVWKKKKKQQKMDDSMLLMRCRNVL